MNKIFLLSALLFGVFLTGELKTEIATSHTQSQFGCECGISNGKNSQYKNCRLDLGEHNKTKGATTIQINLNSLLNKDCENTVICFNTSARFFILNEKEQKVCICDSSAHEFFSLYVVYNFGKDITSFDEISDSDIYKSLIESGLKPVMIKTFKRKDNSGYITKFQMDTPEGFSGTIQIINE